MSLVFAAAMGHAPGITAWADAAPAPQKEALYTGFDELARELRAARPDALIVLTSEHWANFFLDHASAFCVGRGAHFDGPVEPWLKVERARIPGAPALAAALIDDIIAADMDPSFSDEMMLDHGTMVPLHFVTPAMDVPIVPVMINTLMAPQPSARRCLTLGRAVGRLAARSGQRIGVLATGGMSHDPGEVRHGWIDSDFDRRFLAEMAAGDLDALARYSTDALMAAGAGAMELLAWIALAGAVAQVTGAARGRVVAYEPVQPWATGIGAMILATEQAGVA